MTDNLVAFLYMLMACFYLAMGVSLLNDARRNHLAHQALRPIVVWIGAMFTIHAVFFVGTAAARLYLMEYGCVAPWLVSPFWGLLLVAMTVTVVGFYAAFRRVR